MSCNYTCGCRKSISITSIRTCLAVGCKHTGCKSCYGQDLEPGGFTMPSLGNSSFKSDTFYIKLYELTNLCVDTLACIFRFLCNGTLQEVLAGHGMVIEDSDKLMGPF